MAFTVVSLTTLDLGPIAWIEYLLKKLVSPLIKSNQKSSYSGESEIIFAQ